MRVDFWFHPGCPWTWVTSRWLLAVAPQRDLDIHWRSYSLTLLNGCADVPPTYRARAEGAHDVLRVVEAARAAGAAQTAIGDFYTGAARELFGGEWPLHVPDTLAAAGLDPSLAAAFSDPAWDEVIQRSMMEAESLCGAAAASPTIALGSTPDQAFFGPVLARVPDGDAAVEIWDAVATLISHRALYELKRDRMEGLQIPGA
ncbi:MAG: disulfide bond formation protein DsbA [Actinomycetota bacterium]|nr:disulfide bond formation protein DsbA [Actinomycetota bacterium]